MKEIKRISESFKETLTDSNLHNVTIGLAETITDSFITDGILRDIPIIGTIVGLTKASMNVADTLFLNKIFAFLSELESIKPSDRKKMIDKIDSSEKYSVKVGEKLLYIIDKSDDRETAKLIAKLFVAFLENELDYSDFLKSAKIIENIYIGDLTNFLKKDENQLGQDDIDDFLNTGLITTYTEEVSVEDEDDWKAGNRYKVKGGKTKVYITWIGDQIRRILNKDTN